MRAGYWRRRRPGGGELLALRVRYHQVQRERIATLAAEVNLPAGAQRWHHWYIDGLYAGQSAGPEWSVPLSPGEQPELLCRVVRYRDYDPLRYPPRRTPRRWELHWVRSADPDVAYYSLEHATGLTPGAYSEFARVPASAQWVHRALSPLLADAAYHWLRIRPVSAAGVAGSALTVGPIYLVRAPDVPAYQVSYEQATQRVTFAAL